MTIVEGSLLVGFVSSNQDGNRQFSKVLNKGDLFVSPYRMYVFKRTLEIAREYVVATTMFGSKSRGFEIIENTLFGSLRKSRLLLYF